MGKQILKGFTMLMLIVGLAFVSAVVSANGQSTQLVANIPFEFNVGDKALPSGEYSVKAIAESVHALAIRSQDATAIRLTRSIAARKAPEKAKLVFHRYGERYFLSEVWTAGEKTGRRLLKSKQERVIEDQLAAMASKTEIAKSNYERVEIVAMVR